jgi:hypothetical protein
MPTCTAYPAACPPPAAAGGPAGAAGLGLRGARLAEYVLSRVAASIAPEHGGARTAVECSCPIA